VGRWSGWRRSVVAELKSRPLADGLLAVFMLACPVLGLLLFPEAPPAVAVIGGMAVGLYAAVVAGPQKFL
jgi:hypothetical protein